LKQAPAHLFVAFIQFDVNAGLFYCKLSCGEQQKVHDAVVLWRGVGDTNYKNLGSFQ
jgi:hypothetical protein